MKNKSFNFIIYALALIVFMGMYSCKSQKKMAGATKPAQSNEATVTKKPSTEESATKPAEVTPARTAVADRLENYFNAIASSPSLETANSNIGEALTLFASGDVPVIIAFFKENGVKDFDEPTTISKYLNYIKDQKTNPNKVDNVITDTSGKIVELDLIKR